MDRKRYFIMAIAVVFSVFLSTAAFAVDQMRSSAFFVTSSPSQVSGNLSAPFTVYIGDNLAGVTDPIKSAHIEVSGVYTGGGSVSLSIESDSNSSKTFTLPSVSGPTPFELVYTVTSSLGIASAGEYAYTLNVNPSGVTISGLGAVAKVTHRYKPVNCSAGYPIYSDVVSATIDTQAVGGAAYNSVLWKGNLGGPSQNQGKVRFQLATSDSPSGPWDFVGGTSCTVADWFEPGAADAPIEVNCYSDLNNKRYFKYKVRICSNDCVAAGDYTPTIQDVIVNWSP